jgi:isopenicillin N synthase-like dioxygenase
MELPVIDVGPLLGRPGDAAQVAAQLGAACRAHGFFYAANHGVPEQSFAHVVDESARFFALPEATKAEIAMARGGRAWRGWFPVGGELTSGQPDVKEGIYFGEELSLDDARVRAGLPLHGPNLFPAQVPELKPAVLELMGALTGVGHALMRGLALSLGLPESYFAQRYTARPLTLFRVFHYPPDRAPGAEQRWGVGEHTDYGVLTLLHQDDVGGLEVKTPSGWIAAPPVPGTLVCNIGDMLERMTGGHYRSTPHRVRNATGRERYSLPFFFDPDFDAEMHAVQPPPAEDGRARWDGRSVFDFQGTYGDYLLGKVSKVFPELARRQL